MPTMKQKERNTDEQTRKNENLLKQIPNGVFQRAKTIFSLNPKSKNNDKKQGKIQSRNRLKMSRSEPEFQDKAHSKSSTPIKEDAPKRMRPMSLGPSPRRSSEREDYRFSRDDCDYYSRKYDSMEGMEYLHSRLSIPIRADRIDDGVLEVVDSLDRPRKKLSFREPEVTRGRNFNLNQNRNMKLMGVNSLTRNSKLHLQTHSNDYDNNNDSDLESQAMRIVRTVGQAFEVCHKLSSNTSDAAGPGSSCDDRAAPSVSDAPSEPIKKESAWEASVEASGGSSGDCASTSGAEKPAERPQKLDLLPPPPRKENRRSPQRTIATPSIQEVSECGKDPQSGGVEMSSSVSCATPLSSQHELQLLKERLEQQSQQTRAAVAQLLLLRDQLAAEQAARCEAQARTHQLLVHNKELLDHITALVAHLQEREKGSRHTPISSHHLTLVPQETPATPQDTQGFENNNRIIADNAAFVELLTPSSAKGSNYNLNNNYQVSSLTSTPPTSVHGINTAHLNNPFNNNIDQIISQLQSMNTNNNPPNQFYQNCVAFPGIPPLIDHSGNIDLESLLQKNQMVTRSNVNLNGQMQKSPNSSLSHLSLISPSPGSGSKDSTPVSSEDGVAYIMPLSHSTTLTAKDSDGRVRLIVPVSPSGSMSDFDSLKGDREEKSSGVTLNITDESGVTRRALPTRTTSEKVPNRSGMMDAMRMQRTRHTTKE